MEIQADSNIRDVTLEMYRVMPLNRQQHHEIQADSNIRDVTQETM